jgi:hypothetical protein
MSAAVSGTQRNAVPNAVPGSPRNWQPRTRLSRQRLGVIADGFLLAFPAGILMLAVLIADPLLSSATALLIGVAYGFGAAISWVIAASHAGTRKQVHDV